MHGGADRVTAICGRFDGGDLLAFGGGDWRHAGTNGLTIQVNGAGATQGCTTTKFGAGHAQRVAQGPENRGAWVYVDRILTAIDVEIGRASCRERVCKYV